MDEPWGEEQARLLHLAMTRAGITLEQLWLFYLHLGGTAHRLEIDAYLHCALKLPRAQRDLLARAANTLITRLPLPCAPYSTELENRSQPDAAHTVTRPSTTPGHRAAGHADNRCGPGALFPPQQRPPTEPIP
jgi:hypothetical protein